MGSAAKLLLMCFLALTISACTQLPRGAAIQREITTAETDAQPDIAVYPITRSFLPTLAAWPVHGTTPHKWLNASHGSDAQIIRPGDMLNLTIWDSGENSLLTGADQRAAALTGLRVSGAGTIFVPYVGKLKVSGQTPDSARALVQRQLEQSAPSVQVQLLMAEGRRNTIDLVSGVKAPGSITIPSQNFSVLSALSAGGGVDSDLSNPQIKLLRGKHVYRTALQRLYDDPKLDTRLHGGDKIIIQADARYFLSLGAAGQEAQFPFPRDTVSALDALTLIGGVADTRADPKGILILREYPASSVGSGGPKNPRVVFTLDMTASDGLFSARHFHIQSGDLVLATESPLANTQNVLGIIGASLGFARATN
jgi:polysaccharide export outer membrane protein